MLYNESKMINVARITGQETPQKDWFKKMCKIAKKYNYIILNKEK